MGKAFKLQFIIILYTWYDFAVMNFMPFFIDYLYQD